MILLTIGLLIICGYLCYKNDKLSIQAKHDEQWKVAADRRIKELDNESLNHIEI